MASIHKDQRQPRPAASKPTSPSATPPSAPLAAKIAGPAGAADHDGDHDHGPAARPAPAGPSPIPLKVFTVLLAIGLITSALLGVTIALTNRARRTASLVTLALGLLVPLTLLFV